MTPSEALITAFERASGRTLVMRAGARPHVLLDNGTVRDIGSNEMTAAAVHGLCNELVPEQARLTLHRDRFLRHPLVAANGSTYVLTVESGAGGMALRLERDDRPEPAPALEIEETAIPLPEAEPPTMTAPPSTPPVAAPPPVASAAPELSDDTPVVLPVPSQEEIATPPPVQAPQHVMTVTAPAPPVAPARPPAVTARAGDTAPSSGAMLTDGSIEWWIVAARASGATQLYLRAGASPAVRLADGIRPLLDRSLSADEVMTLRGQLQPSRPGWVQQGHVHTWTDGDGAVAHCTVFTDRAGVGLTVRMQATGGLAQIAADLPPFAREICSGFEGLAVVAAPTRRELTPVLAGISTWITRGRAVHLISIERESDASLEPGMAFVSQRRVGANDDLFAAVSAAISETPDVLVLEDVPSAEVLAAAIGASREGCLVVAGVTARDSVDAMQLLVRTAPADQQSEVASSLAAVWKGAFSRRTLPQRAGGRVSVCDTLAAVPSVTQHLLDLDFSSIRNVQALRVRGMRTLSDALARVVHRRRVAGRVAAACTSDRAELAAALRERRRRLRSTPAQEDWTPVPIRALA